MYLIFEYCFLNQVGTTEAGGHVYTDHHALIDSLPQLFIEFLKARRLVTKFDL
jgi:hypothetical protein